jgi:hypothetical protein
MYNLGSSSNCLNIAIKSSFIAKPFLVREGAAGEVDLGQFAAAFSGFHPFPQLGALVSTSIKNKTSSVLFSPLTDSCPSGSFAL